MRGKRLRPSEGQEVETPYVARHKWYRVVSIAPEGDALRTLLPAAAVNRLAAAGGAPAGAVRLAISRVLCSGVDRLHVSLRTSSDRTMGEAMNGVVKVVKEFRRATQKKDDIGRILDEVRAADRVASADERFVYGKSDKSGGERPTGPRQRHRSAMALALTRVVWAFSKRKISTRHTGGGEEAVRPAAVNVG